MSNFATYFLFCFIFCYLYYYSVNNRPVFNSEASHCMYVFDWNTTIACIESEGTPSCEIEHKNRHFDMRSLMKREGQ